MIGFPFSRSPRQACLAVTVLSLVLAVVVVCSVPATAAASLTIRRVALSVDYATFDMETLAASLESSEAAASASSTQTMSSQSQSTSESSETLSSSQTTSSSSETDTTPASGSSDSSSTSAAVVPHSSSSSSSESWSSSSSASSVTAPQGSSDSDMPSSASTSSSSSSSTVLKTSSSDTMLSSSASGSSSSVSSSSGSRSSSTAVIASSSSSSSSSSQPLSSQSSGSSSSSSSSKNTSSSGPAAGKGSSAGPTSSSSSSSAIAMTGTVTRTLSIVHNSAVEASVAAILRSYCAAHGTIAIVAEEADSFAVENSGSFWQPASADKPSEYYRAFVVVTADGAVLDAFVRAANEGGVPGVVVVEGWTNTNTKSSKAWIAGLVIGLAFTGAAEVLVVLQIIFKRKHRMQHAAVYHDTGLYDDLEMVHPQQNAAGAAGADVVTPSLPLRKR